MNLEKLKAMRGFMQCFMAKMTNNGLANGMEDLDQLAFLLLSEGIHSHRLSSMPMP